MKTIKHVLSQPFLLAVSLAALAHSSWSFSTLFTGLEPQPQLSPAWFAWVVPGVLLAFSVDIGLLSLANQIREGQRTRGNMTAFGVLCLAMAFLQFLYIAHHAPAVTLGDGIRGEWIPLVSLIRDASIWVLPGLLPVALCLFAFSEKLTPAQPGNALAVTEQPLTIEKPAQTSESEVTADPARPLSPVHPNGNGRYV